MTYYKSYKRKRSCTRKPDNKSKRIVKVYSASSMNQIPQIKLQGLWLDMLGFSIGKKIIVNCKNGKLVIELY